jgi:hypothetical protein
VKRQVAPEAITVSGFRWTDFPHLSRNPRVSAHLQAALQLAVQQGMARAKVSGLEVDVGGKSQAALPVGNLGLDESFQGSGFDANRMEARTGFRP